MNPLLNYAISKFRLSQIPVPLQSLPPFIGSLVVSLIPFTPLNILLYLTIFTLVYLLNPFGLGTANSYSCTDNRLNSVNSTSIWATLKDTYYIYFIIAYIINLITLTDVQIVKASIDLLAK